MKVVAVQNSDPVGSLSHGTYLTPLIVDARNTVIFSLLDWLRVDTGTAIRRCLEDEAFFVSLIKDSFRGSAASFSAAAVIIEESEGPVVDPEKWLVRSAIMGVSFAT